MNCKTADHITTNKTSQRNSIIEDANRLRSAGFTLLELIIVLVILVALAGIIVPVVTGIGDVSREAATESSMAELRDTITQYYNDLDKKLPRPDGGSRVNRPQVVFLFVNPATYEDGNPSNDVQNDWDPRYALGWRGPYISQSTGSYSLDAARNFTSDYGVNGDRCVADSWGNPIVIQNPITTLPIQVRLVSAGRNGVIDTDPLTATESLASTSDDLLLTFELN